MSNEQSSSHTHAVPAQSGATQRSGVATGADYLRSSIDVDDDSKVFQAAVGQYKGRGSGSNQPMAAHRTQLEADLMRFRNGEISVSELEQALINFENALEEAGIETPWSVEGGQLVNPSNATFSIFAAEAQQSIVQHYLDKHDPIKIYGERLADTLADFDSERASGQDLEQALIDFEENLNAMGITTPGSVNDGQYNWPVKLGQPNRGPVDLVDTPFSWMSREQQSSAAEHVLDQYLYNSPEALRVQRHNLAASLYVPDDPDLAARIGAQTALVEELAQQLAANDTPTEAQRLQLVEETTKLVAMLEEAPYSYYGLWSYDEATDSVIVRYNKDRPRPGMSTNSLASLNDRDPDWFQRVSISNMEIPELLRFVATPYSITLGTARTMTLDHPDVIGIPPPSLPMTYMQRELGYAQPPPDNVDPELAFQINMTVAQLRLIEDDLKNYENHLMDAVRAVLGDQGWGVDGTALYSAFKWITRGAQLSTEIRADDNSVTPRSQTEIIFAQAWDGTSREGRIEYLGFDVETWNRIEPLLEMAYNAREQRKDAEFGLDDFVKIAGAAFAAYVTGGLVGPAVTGWLGGGTIATVVGGAAGGAAGSFMSTLIISGDWVTARESFKDIFEGDLKEGLAEIALNYVGLDPRYASIANAATSDEVVDQLTNELGFELVQQFSAPFIEGLKAYSPEIVDRYLDDLQIVLLASDNPEAIAEHAIGWWAGELASMIGVTNENGIKLVTSMLDTAVTSGEFDVNALQEFLGQEVVEYLADVPAEVVERLGGHDSALALLGGVAAQLVVNNLDTAIEGDSFIDAARREFEEFVTDIAQNWVDQGGLEAALSWIPGSANWATDFSEMVQVGHQSGWDQDELQAHLSESSLFTNLVNSYMPAGPGQDYLTRAIQYASEHDLDPQAILNAATVDMVDILANAGISQDVVNFLGGNGAVLSQMGQVFGERLIANNGDLGAALRDMEQYARGLAAGHVGDFTQSILAQALGPGAGQAIDAVSGLVEGVAAGWSDTMIDDYIETQILLPLGESAAAVVIGAFGGEENFVGGLLGAVTDSYLDAPDDNGAARDAAIDYLLSRLASLVSGSDPQAQGQLASVGPSHFSLAESVTQLIEFANNNNWNEQAIQNYIENQFLNNGLAGNLIDTLLGGFGTPAQLSAVLVEELISVHNETGDPTAVIERFVTFMLSPPTLPDTNATDTVTPSIDDIFGDGGVIIPASFRPDLDDGGLATSILDDYQPTGASAATASQDGLQPGVDASRQMAENDADLVMAHQDVFNEIGALYDLPPALLAAIASRESRGGAALESDGTGDHGNGFGIMQVDQRYHTVQGRPDPASVDHIDQAASILADMLAQVQREHPDWPPERQLQGAVAAYNFGAGNVQTLDGMDIGTTGDDYSNDVWARAQYYDDIWQDDQIGDDLGNSDIEIPSGVVLRAGDESPQVIQLQNVLLELGLLDHDADVDGEFGPRTQAALEEFQRSAGITVDGVFGSESEAAMRSLENGIGVGSDESGFIDVLQQKLVDLGFMTESQRSSGPGIFGPNTQRAVSDYQSENGLPVTGQLDVATFRSLEVGGFSVRVTTPVDGEPDLTAVASDVAISPGEDSSVGISPTVATGLGADVDALVALSPTLTQAIDTIQRAGYTIEFGPAGEGTSHNRAAKEIVIDENKKGDPLSIVRSLAHEAGHAGFPGEPFSYVAIGDLSRQEYIDANTWIKLDGEAEATLVNLEIRQEILDNGGADIGVSGRMAEEYKKIFASGLHETDRAAARELIANIFATQEFPSTDPSKTYEQYWGDFYGRRYDRNS